MVRLCNFDFGFVLIPSSLKVRAWASVHMVTNLIISGKVVAELTKVFTVIVLQNQNGVPCVLLHIVFKVGNHGVDSVLKGFHTADQGDFLFVILERNQRNPCPVEPLGFLAFFLNHEIVFVFTGFHIGNQHSR